MVDSRDSLSMMMWTYLYCCDISDDAFPFRETWLVPGTVYRLWDKTEKVE